MKLAINAMALLAVLALTGCSINVVVAPHAVFAVDSAVDSPVDASEGMNNGHIGDNQ